MRQPPILGLEPLRLCHGRKTLTFGLADINDSERLTLPMCPLIVAVGKGKHMLSCSICRPLSALLDTTKFTEGASLI